MLGAESGSKLELLWKTRTPMFWHQIVGHKWPVLGPRCIGTERARTQLLIYSTILYWVNLQKHRQHSRCTIPTQNSRLSNRKRSSVSLYRVSIKSFPDYKPLLQENYVEYEHIFLPLLKLVSKILCCVFIVMLQLCVCIPCSFLIINVRNQGNTLCSTCRYSKLP